MCFWPQEKADKNTNEATEPGNRHTVGDQMETSGRIQE